MRQSAKLVGLLVMSVVPTASSATSADKYHITVREKAACTQDAMRFCLGTYPNEDLLLACMKANRSQLSLICGAAFDAGVKKRRLQPPA